MEDLEEPLLQRGDACVFETVESVFVKPEAKPVPEQQKTSKRNDAFSSLGAHSVAASLLLKEGCGVGTPQGLLYKLSRRDTLVGLSLRFDVSTAALRSANFLTSDRLNSYFFLIIPVPWCEEGTSYDAEQVDEAAKNGETPSSRERAKQTLMILASDIGPKEAEYYIAANDSNFGKALAHMKEDHAWERGNPAPKRSSDSKREKKEEQESVLRGMASGFSGISRGVSELFVVAAGKQ